MVCCITLRYAKVRNSVPYSAIVHSGMLCNTILLRSALFYNGMLHNTSTGLHAFIGHIHVKKYGVHIHKLER